MNDTERTATRAVRRGAYPELTWAALLVGWRLWILIAMSIGYAALILGFSIEDSELAAILGLAILRGKIARMKPSAGRAAPAVWVVAMGSAACGDAPIPPYQPCNPMDPNCAQLDEHRVSCLLSTTRGGPSMGVCTPFPNDEDGFCSVAIDCPPSPRGPVVCFGAPLSGDPPFTAGFCALSCVSDADCPRPARCLPVTDRFRTTGDTTTICRRP